MGGMNRKLRSNLLFTVGTLAVAEAVTFGVLALVPDAATSVPVTGDAYADCLALAEYDYAPEVCEPLAPSATVMPRAIPSEVTAAIPPGMCPTEDSCYAEHSAGQWRIIRGERTPRATR